MKQFSTILLLVVLFLFSTFSISFAQVNWTKHSTPVLSPGLTGAWDEEFAAFPSVLFVGSGYHMWYGNYNYVIQQTERIGYATSSDGITWQKYDDPTTTNPPFAQSDPVLNPGASGTYDDVAVSVPCVLMINNIYHMWYGGSDYPVNGGTICYATSPDGVVWSKDSLNNPVLDVGLNGTWDDTYVWGPCVVFDDSIYHLWYNGGSSGSISRIGHATAPHPDSAWTKDPNNPVLDPGSSSSWDYPGVDAGSVIYDGTLFHMFYSGGGFAAWRIGYAWSTDGSNWTKYDNNPVLDWGAAGTFDDISVSHCSVFLDSANNIFKMWYTAIDTIYGNHIGAKVGYATAPITTIYVPGNFPTIQAAINSASDGNIILVADGIYQENINFKGKAITVASHYYFDGDTSHISNTIIDGSNPSHPDSGSVVYFVSGEDTNSVLCGFTITGGTGTPTTLWSNVYRSGGGVFCVGASGAKIINNYITKNRVIGDYAAGGGILYSEDNGFLILERNRIFGNHVYAESGLGIGGGAEVHGDDMFARIVENVFESDTVIAESFAMGGGVDISADPGFANGIIQGNVFRENIAEAKVSNGCGGGLGCYATAAMEIRDNLFESNIAKSRDVWAEGGGILIDDEFLSGYGRKLVAGNHFVNNKSIGTYASGGALEIFRTLATVSSNYFEQNTVQGGIANGGAIRIYKSAFLLENNIITENTSTLGGAVYVSDTPQSGSGMEIINNTIVNNSASSSGGGIAVNGVPMNIVNSILWGNTPNQIYTVSGGSASVGYSDVQGGWTGTTNINSDPLFADSLLYELSETSPCVGAGTDSLAPPFDYDGDPRPNPIDEHVDIGAQESPYEKPTGIVKDDSDNLPRVFSLKQNYPNPFNPITNIQFSIPKSEFVTLKIYNLLGQEIEKLVSKQLIPGNYKYTWDASQYASGIYMYKIEAGNYAKTKKLILLK